MVMARNAVAGVSVLFNEPKLLKSQSTWYDEKTERGFSALQRAEIAEIDTYSVTLCAALRFSALQRAEIAEIIGVSRRRPKSVSSFSALQRAEIAEMISRVVGGQAHSAFQCSSTSRNC